MEELVYLCGPIDSRICQGESYEEKRERFAVAQAYHEAHGRKVFNPLLFSEELLKQEPQATIFSIMLREQSIIKEKVTEMFLMQNWQYSKGCLEEVNLAGRLWLPQEAKLEAVYPPRMIQFSYETFDTIMAGREYLVRQRTAEHQDSRTLELIDGFLNNGTDYTDYEDTDRY